MIKWFPVRCNFLFVNNDIFFVTYDHFKWNEVASFLQPFINRTDVFWS